MPVLVHQDDPPIVVDGHDRDGTDMDHEVPLGVPAPRHRHVVAHHGEHRADELHRPVAYRVHVAVRAAGFLVDRRHSAPTRACAITFASRPAAAPTELPTASRAVVSPPTASFSTVTGRRPESEYASAAATSPSNSGCDRVGRLFSSGCA